MPAVSTLVTTPSPKLQLRWLMVPVELSVNMTTSGAGPLVGLALKLATGRTAPVPVNPFVATPPFAVEK